MLFKNVIGQADVKLHLVNMVQHNRISHALLFLGKEGSGGLPLAIAFAQYVVCEKVNRKGAAAPAGASLFGEEAPATSQNEGMPDSCGECPSCQKMQQLMHPDIHFSYPVIPRKAGDKPLSSDYISEWREFIAKYPYGNSYDWLQFIGAENKQGNITAYECNDIIRKLSLKSFESGFKILVMWMPEYLGNEGNKLLKLIEEPPPNTLFILVAENESLILQTILSRTQLVKIPTLTPQEIAGALVAKAKLAEDPARQIALIAEGNYREALQLMQHADEDWQSLLREWLNAILKNGPIAQVKWIDEVSKLGREKQKQFLRYFNHLLEQAIRLQAMGPENVHLADKDKDFAGRLNKIAGFHQQQAIIEELDKASYYIERNANPKMLFHALTIKLYHIIAAKQVTNVI
ncbi:DNA polymerase III subunit [Niastella caeni]|uniref:DNA polymerase III subunit n=1 Tax=Niastella caeni TaxID=2569763 RepID=A0A4S8HRL7_9BACT|nr:DNA polymerase III subunit delta' [Niastella caeni]THU37169.1 DNA polymerase III subunit [Niastella caeni]